MKRFFLTSVAFFIAFVLIGAASQFTVSKKRPSKQTIAQAREECVTVIADLLQAIHEHEKQLLTVKSDLFISIRNVFEESEEGCLMTKDLSRLEAIKKAVDALIGVLEGDTLKKRIQSVIESVQEAG